MEGEYHARGPRATGVSINGEFMTAHELDKEPVFLQLVKLPADLHVDVLLDHGRQESAVAPAFRIDGLSVQVLEARW